MEEQKSRSTRSSRCARSVVHARVGQDGCGVLAELATRKGVSQTQALRSLLEDAKERMAEDAFGPRLEGLARTLLGVAEQQARHAARLEALVAILRKVEEGQAERETQIFQTLSAVLGVCQLAYAHILGIVESSPRATEITTSAQAKMRVLRGEA